MIYTLKFKLALRIKLHTDIELRVVDTENLEMLRQLRNHALIQDVLVHRGIISEYEQKKWFDNIDGKTAVYFLIFISDEIKGYALLKKINTKESSGEPGLFLIDNHFSSLGGILTLSFLDFCNDFFGINYFYGNVLNSNTRALLNYNYFDTEKNQNEGGFSKLHAIAKYAEMKKVNKLREYIQKQDNYKRIFIVSFSASKQNNIPDYNLNDNIIVINTD